MPFVCTFQIGAQTALFLGLDEISYTEYIKWMTTNGTCSTLCVAKSKLNDNSLAK